MHRTSEPKWYAEPEIRLGILLIVVTALALGGLTWYGSSQGGSGSGGTMTCRYIRFDYSNPYFQTPIEAYPAPGTYPDCS